MITAIVLARNEEKHIIDCLISLNWCDEVLVIDDYSTDRTAAYAKKHGAKIFEHALQNNFSSQRNFAISKATHEWAFFVDADEKVSQLLREEIQQIISSNKHTYSGFKMKRKDILWGRELQHGETNTLQLLRLGKKSAGVWRGAVHEVWDIKGNTANLENSLFHYPHQSITEFLEEINFYTDLRAKELYKQGVKANLLNVVAYPIVKFILNYIIKQGFRDGIPGLLVACFMSFHSFLVRSKLWVLWHT